MLVSRVLRTFCFGKLPFTVSPHKLLALSFIWILPYLLFANYLERSLLFFRLTCYTQADLISSASYSDSLEGCVQKLFQGRRMGEEDCGLDRMAEVVLSPSLPGSPFNSLVVVRTAPKSRDYRDFIRRTWKRDVERISPVVFVTALGADLSDESSLNSDILQFNFTDSYKGLSKKMTSTFAWFTRHLPDSVDRLIVVNDDTIINVTALAALRTDPSSQAWIVGKVSRGYPRLIFPWLTWFVSAYEYPALCYPRFVQGSSYIISRPAMTELFSYACRVPSLPLDDIWMGVLSLCLPIKLIHREGFDVHVSTSPFVVFHYQYERYTPKKLESIYANVFS